MFHPLSLWLGLRYTRAKRRNHFISFISVISMAGIFVGVTALITVLSVMNGFEKELRDRILGVASHATINRLGGPVTDWSQVAQTALQHEAVEGAAPYVQGQVMFVKGDRVTGARLRGVLPDREADVSDVHRNMIDGELSDLSSGDYGVVLGSELASYLGIQPGDRVTVVTPEASVTPVGVLPRLKRMTVRGVFEIGMHDYDRSTAFAHIDDARKLMRIEDGGVSGVRLRLTEMFQAPTVTDAVEANIGPDYWIQDWTQRHANFFQAVRTEKTVMFVILALIIAVAAFNIVSTLVMMVTDKESDIAILRTLGMTPAAIMAIFLVQGTLIGVIGTGLGVAGGIALASHIGELMPALEALFGINLLPSDVYYISDLPSDLQTTDVVEIAVLAIMLSILATIYPARRAARTQPAEALRYD